MKSILPLAVVALTSLTVLSEKSEAAITVDITVDRNVPDTVLFTLSGTFDGPTPTDTRFDELLVVDVDDVGFAYGSRRSRDFSGPGIRVTDPMGGLRGTVNEVSLYSGLIASSNTFLIRITSAPRVGDEISGQLAVRWTVIDHGLTAITEIDGKNVWWGDETSPTAALAGITTGSVIQVPEPSTSIFASVALLGAACLRRRKS